MNRKESKIFTLSKAALVVLAFAGCQKANQEQNQITEETYHSYLPSISREVPFEQEPIFVPSPEPSPTPEVVITRPPGEIVRGNLERPEIALTFDCGASGVPTPTILGALGAENIKATFFLTGKWVQQYPDLARQIAAEHEIGNHSFSHPDFKNLTNEQILAEMELAEQIIFETTGKETRPLWRAPFGSRDARILSVIKAAGWIYHIFWTADSGDWIEGILPQTIKDNINNRAQNGTIFVQHCGSTQTAQIIAAEITDLEAKGYKLTTVSDLLRD